MVTRTVNVLSLCAGAGALDAGLKLALPQARTVCYVENEISEAAVLAKGIASSWLDDAPIWSDLKTFDSKPWRGLVDCIIGGYPCQPFSSAGLRRGVSDPRHLWPYVATLIDELRPALCFFENVAGHLKLGYYDVVRPSLASMGYHVTEGLFTATEVGAPHTRRRLFILAYSGDEARSTESTQQQEASAKESRRRGAQVASNVADSHSQRRDRQSDEESQERWLKLARGGAILVDTNNERLDRRRAVSTQDGNQRMPWPPGPTSLRNWESYLESGGPEPLIRRGSDGMAYRRDRLHVAGNGVVPAMAAKAFSYLARNLVES